jgi:hypothetical protein
VSWRFLLAACGLSFLGGLLSLGCSHTPFETCVRNAAVKLAETKVQAALACGGQKACLEQAGIEDGVQFIDAAAVCASEAVDGGR